jgi:F0F1-type ATP synthase membrane subunit c/vacuolar-type H+-ATPase subunit K
MGLTIGLGACMVGVASAFALGAASTAVARQPASLTKIQMLSFIVQTLIETPVFLTLVVAMLIKHKLSVELTLVDGIRFLAAGLIMGCASIGPSIGQMLFTSKCCLAPGLNRQAYNKIFTFTILTEAFLETPLLLALVAVILILLRTMVLSTISSIGLFLGALFGLCISAIGVGVGSGFLAGKGIMQIAENPDNYSSILGFNIICQILIETAIIFSFVVVLLIFFGVLNA